MVFIDFGLAHVPAGPPIRSHSYPESFAGSSEGKESVCSADLVWSLGGEDPLEKGMATHSGILAWRIPWREEPGGLQSMESQRVRHNWATNTFTAGLVNLGSCNMNRVTYKQQKFLSHSSGSQRSECQHARFLDRSHVWVADCRFLNESSQGTKKVIQLSDFLSGH